MSDGLVTVARHLRVRAEAMRSLAEVMTGAETRTIMRRLAGDYDLLARRADEHAQSKWSICSQRARARVNRIEAACLDRHSVSGFSSPSKVSDRRRYGSY
jgi:hypothetical protein